MSRLPILALLLLPLLPAAAQEEDHYRLDDATQLWRHTDNAAGLAIDNSRDRGYTQLGYDHHEGSLARVQEGNMGNSLTLQTERYQHVGQYLHAYGRFSFDYGRTKNRAWADVRRPYQSNPFIAGSAVSGTYDHQDFDFTAAMGTTSFGPCRYGLRLDYMVGDLSRLRDPRSRSQLLDYRLTPSATLTLGQHTAGLTAYYHRRKEKIGSLTTVQQTPNLQYYLMTGMEHAEGTVGGYTSFGREWVDHRFGAALAYALYTDKLNSLTSFTLERGTEYAYGQYKYEPGRYVSACYDIDSRHRITTAKGLHQIDLTASATQAYADEYHQQLVMQNDPVHGYTSYHYETTINYRKRHQLKTTHANLHYRYSMVHDGIKGYVGMQATYDDANSKHLLPVSQLHTATWDVAAEGGHALPRLRLWADVRATYHHAAKAYLQLADATTDLARQVLLPDMPYYEACYWQGRVALTWQFPLTIKKNTATWYVKAYGDYLSTDNSLHAASMGFSVGLFN